ncbi:uncharacterized protein MONOS_13523 [Monocercomonoides exilis]|uniref:uncharacterized protein n=1 Tax=Monocercomonoides exilis TaxID=2049356 RepID=UPI00355AB72A|nr:hypothetical protein MONOS_13523 [Monocercomonoides exilis]|eukprot:MONOS_13523.1-p1 / transcript=MONOS_13523.1 / gene=MONOS_13523 / organism=Monocercomonoides_exilis_PA203 / gene_product=unspecified product / transcript_product=unspecified product / location=Mono_scaffold00839:21905-22672(+) / protein_length=256 / sequence_SO=supercontig / SO=protein_coding / is_pseudo=false
MLHPSSTLLKTFDTTSLSFFGEGHGKSEVDGEFGVLARIVQRSRKDISTLKDLITFFQKAFPKNERKEDKRLERFIINYSPRIKQKTSLKLVVKDIKTYLCWRSTKAQIEVTPFFNSSVSRWRKISFESVFHLNKKQSTSRQYICKDDVSTGSSTISLYKRRLEKLKVIDKENEEGRIIFPNKLSTENIDDNENYDETEDSDIEPIRRKVLTDQKQVNDNATKEVIFIEEEEDVDEGVMQEEKEMGKKKLKRMKK